MNTLCPLCECPVQDYAPGESCTEYNGQFYHPACLVGERLIEWTARHIEAKKHLVEKFMAAVRKADDMQDKIEIARVIRDCWGATTFEIEGN